MLCGNDLEYRFDVAGVVACPLTLIVTRALLAGWIGVIGFCLGGGLALLLAPIPGYGHPASTTAASPAGP